MKHVVNEEDDSTSSDSMLSLEYASHLGLGLIQKGCYEI